MFDIESGKFLINRDVIYKETVFPFKYPRSEFLSSSDTTSISSSFLHFPASSIIEFYPEPSTKLPSATEPNINPEHLPVIDSVSASSPSSIPPPLPPHSTSSLSILSPASIPDPPRRLGRYLKPSIWLTYYLHPHLSYTSSSYPIQHFVRYSHLPTHF